MLVNRGLISEGVPLSVSELRDRKRTKERIRMAKGGESLFLIGSTITKPDSA